MDYYTVSTYDKIQLSELQLGERFRLKYKECLEEATKSWRRRRRKKKLQWLTQASIKVQESIADWSTVVPSVGWKVIVPSSLVPSQPKSSLSDGL
jgi:hypothetical protein